MNGPKKERLFAFFLGICLISCHSVFAQHFLDSLRDRLRQAKSDTDRIYALYDVADFFAFVDVDSSLRYSEKVIQQSDKLRFLYGRFYANHGIFNAYITQSEYPKAVEIALANLNLADSLGNERKTALALAFGDLAVAYRINKNFDVAMVNARKAVQYFKLVANKHPLEYGTAVSQIGVIKLRANQPDSILFYLHAGYKICSSDRRWNRGSVLGAAYLGDAYTFLNKYKEAAYYYSNALKNAIYSDNLYLQARLLNNMSTLLDSIGSPDSSIYYAKASLKLSERFHFDHYAMDSYASLGSVYESENNTDSAYKYLKLAHSMREKIFSQANIQQIEMSDFNEKKRKQDGIVAEELYKGRVRNFGLLSGVSLLLVIILYRNNLQRKRTNHLLSRQKGSLEATLNKLKSTQTQLIQAEKMASLGEITAGIAHEIQNPLNFVKNFSEVNDELVKEMKQALESGDNHLALELAQDIGLNEDKIRYHGRRADNIVKNMIMHSRASSGRKQETDLNALADEYLRITYHAARAKDKLFNVAIHSSFDPSIGQVNMQPQDFGRALSNLLSNAFYAVTEKKKRYSFPPNEGKEYEPMVSIQTFNLISLSGERVAEIRIRDNGIGIPEDIRDKILQPFFTTKPTGEGTGLGLSLSYDIISKLHGGTLIIESREGEYAEFIIQIPKA